MPSLFAAWILLFGSAFSAYGTAYALTSGNISLVTTEISAVLSGNVVSEPQVGGALSVGMIVVMVVVLALSNVLAARASRWTVKS
jgi:putative spermidine/putrescine transport system permease protein